MPIRAKHSQIGNKAPWHKLNLTLIVRFFGWKQESLSLHLFLGSVSGSLLLCLFVAVVGFWVGFVMYGLSQRWLCKNTCLSGLLRARKVFRSPSMFYTFLQQPFIRWQCIFSHASGVAFGMTLSGTRTFCQIVVELLPSTVFPALVWGLVQTCVISTRWIVRPDLTLSHTMTVWNVPTYKTDRCLEMMFRIPRSQSPSDFNGPLSDTIINLVYLLTKYLKNWSICHILWVLSVLQ